MNTFFIVFCLSIKVCLKCFDGRLRRGSGKMIKRIKNELNENKKYIYLSYLISILTMIPQFITSFSLSLTHLIFLFLVLLVVLLISKFSKLLFSIFIIYLNLTNIIIGHIFIHWGYSGHIRHRIEVAFASPNY